MTDSIPLTPNARTVLERRYLRRDADGTPLEGPGDLFARVAGDIAAAEAVWGGDLSLWEDRFLELITSLRFLPNSPTLMNAGRDLHRGQHQGAAGACSGQRRTRQVRRGRHHPLRPYLPRPRDGLGGTCRPAGRVDRGAGTAAAGQVWPG